MCAQDEQCALSIGLMLWSFATLRYSPLQGEFVRVAYQRLLPLCEDMDSSDITKCLTSLAKMKVRGKFRSQRAGQRMLCRAEGT